MLRNNATRQMQKDNPSWTPPWPSTGTPAKGATPISSGPQKLGAGVISLKPSYESTKPAQSYQPAAEASAVIRYKTLLGS